MPLALNLRAGGADVRPDPGPLLPDQVDGVTPPMGRGQDAVAWEVTGPVTTVSQGWQAPVFGIRVIEAGSR